MSEHEQQPEDDDVQGHLRAGEVEEVDEFTTRTRRRFAETDGGADEGDDVSGHGLGATDPKR